MARPTKWRKIESIPAVSYFVPVETKGADVTENILKLEELEAVRLKDLEGLEQEECADRMEVSRQTFQRILFSARQKIADSLVNGKAIHIGGGNYTRNICRVRCLDCGNSWMENFETLSSIGNMNYVCPHCGSKNIVCGHSCDGKFGHGNCWRHGRRDR